MYRSQRGVTLIGWVVILAIIGYFAIFAMRLVPLYAQKLEVVSLMDAMQNDFDGENATPSRLRQGIRDKFRNKDINVIGPNDIEIVAVKGGHELRATYEHKTDFFHDIGLFVKVDKRVVIER